MHRIAIVDDDNRIAIKISAILEKYYGKNSYMEEEYVNGAEFIREFPEFRPNIVFMDIEMGQMNGEEAVRRLREWDIHENVFVVYVSSHQECLAPLFALHPFDFLVKPFCDEDVIRVLKKIQKKMERQKTSLTFIADRKEITVHVEDIVWIQSIAHKLEIKLCTEMIPIYTYGKLNDLWSKLESMGDEFLRIHASFVVNRSFVTKYTQKAVYIDKMEIPVSAKYRSEVMRRIFETL